MPLLRLASLLALLSLPALACDEAACANAIEAAPGFTRVIDGDTIEIQGEIVRLIGIDAFEAGDAPWGTHATHALEAMIAARAVKCLWLERDRYGRLLGECLAANRNGTWPEKSLNARMVLAGMAVVYPRPPFAYAGEMVRAMNAKDGFWSGIALPADARR